ncbi:MAG: hypothetical protein PHX83_02005 [Acidobacteriia bacterium]|nr:hypothetical protein [Terriglobia bacterium]
MRVSCFVNKVLHAPGLKAALLGAVVFGLSLGPMQIWAKRASDSARRRPMYEKSFSKSKLATIVIPENSQSSVQAGTRNPTIQEEFKHSPGMLNFEQKYGGVWESLVDERSMAPTELLGGGIPFSQHSADANKLDPAARAGLAAHDSIDELANVARQFLTDNQAFLKINPAALQLDRDASGVLEARTGKYRLVFQNTFNGVPILGSYVSLFISHGNLVLYGAEHIVDFALSIQPAYSPQGAVQKLEQSLGLNFGDILLDHAANLMISLVDSPQSKAARAQTTNGNFEEARYDGPTGHGYEARLIYKIEFHVPNDNRSLVALLDAQTGERLDLYDQNRYQSQTGFARGAIYTRGPVSTQGYVNQGGTQAPEFVAPLGRLTITNGSSTVTSNPGGLYSFNALPVLSFTTSLSGFQPTIMEIGHSCPSPQGPADSSGNITFPPHFDDGVCAVSPSSPSPGNGLATHGAVNGWFHTNFAVIHSQKFLMNFSSGLTNFYNNGLAVLVNDSDCEAFWSSGQCHGSVSECIDMGSCGTGDEENNQADEPDTMSHEYGHALDFHTKSTGVTGDRGKGEGLADIDAWLNTHRTCLSPGDGFGSFAPPFGSFFPGVPIGDLCNTAGIPLEPQILQQTGVRDFGVFICHDDGSGACPAGTTGRLESNDNANACGTPGGSSCLGAQGYECHCEGHTSSGSVIDLYKLLVTRYGTNEAWYLIERFYYLGLPGITNAYGTSGQGSIYSNFLAVDDDDGSISNGTPNADLIFQAFLRHGTEGTQRPRSQANCTTAPGPTSPAAPSSFTATAQATGGILLQWSAVSGATGYLLYRTEASQPGHNYENDPVPSSYYGRNGVFFALINPSTRTSNPNSGTNLFAASGSGTQSYLDLETAPGYEYFYQIQAVVPFGGGQSCLSSLSPGGTDLVANATAVGFTQETLPVRFGGATTASTIGSTAPVQAGYGIVTVNSGNAPYGTAVFGLTQSGVIVSEVGVPASPPSIDSLTFIDFRSNVPGKSSALDATTVSIDTGIAVVNPNSVAANVTYTLRASGGLTVVGHGTVAGNSHFAKFIDQLHDVAPDFNLPGNFSTVNQFGTLEISSPSTALSVLALRSTVNQRGETLLTSTPIVDLTQAAPTGNLVFAQVADGGGFKFTIILINTSGAAETGTLRFIKDDGSALTVTQVGGSSGSSFPYNIPAGGFLVFKTDGSPTQINVGSAQVIPDPSKTTPAGAGIFSFTQNQILVTESGVPAATLTTHARVYVDKSGGHDTGLAMANPTGSPLSVTLAAFQVDGATPAGNGNGNASLNGNGHVAKFAGEFISGLPIGFTGVLDITSSSPFAALTLRELINGRGDALLTTFPIADFTRPAPTPIIFPQIADGGGFRTQFILLGATGASTDTLNFFGDSGAAIPVGAKSNR